MDQEDCFEFLSIGDDENQPKDRAMSPPLFTIDEGILPPTICNTGPSERTKCLLSLVAGEGQSHKVFRKMARIVDTLEVSCIDMTFTISHRILG